MKKLLLVFMALAFGAIIGCDTGPASPRGFSLPVGNVEAGKIAFTALNCNACHTIGDIAQQASEPAPEITVRLGGTTSKSKTYAELVTAVINPSHRLVKGYPSEMIQSEGQSRMPNYNSLMTVSQLIDLVTFLESNYKLQVYVPTPYPAVY